MSNVQDFLAENNMADLVLTNNGKLPYIKASEAMTAFAKKEAAYYYLKGCNDGEQRMRDQIKDLLGISECPCES